MPDRRLKRNYSGLAICWLLRIATFGVYGHKWSAISYGPKKEVCFRCLSERSEK